MNPKVGQYFLYDINGRTCLFRITHSGFYIAGRLVSDNSIVVYCRIVEIKVIPKNKEDYYLAKFL